MFAYRISISVAICCYLWQTAYTQAPSPEELLQRSIQYHDPQREWAHFADSLKIKQLRPNGDVAYRDIYIDRPNERFSFRSDHSEGTLRYHVDGDASDYSFAGSRDISDEIRKKYRINADRPKMYQSYYLYLYGLPMKLKDPGTHLHPRVVKTTFKGKSYYRMRVDYASEVGDDRWYFYYNPETYALEMSQFYHDESKLDGEYIYHKGIRQFGSLKLVEELGWYMNVDDRHLGKDVLTNGKKVKMEPY